MTPETEPRRDDVIRSEAEVLEIAREVLGRFYTRLDDCPAPFFRPGLTTQNDDTETNERS